LVYFVGTHTRSTVPRGRSAAALGDDATVAQILVPSVGTRVGKGLINRSLQPMPDLLSKVHVRLHLLLTHYRLLPPELCTYII